MQRLILFDIDGTLTRTQNGYVPFNQALLDTFGVAGDIRAVIPDGNTDPRIVEEIFSKGKIDIKIVLEQWQHFATNLQCCYAKAIKEGTTKIHALPGAVELVRTLSLNENVIQGVVTGNFKVTARIKLEAAELGTFLPIGAYACDSPNRGDLPNLARKRCEELTSKSIPAKQCVIVGDTARDLEAARANGMKCILVGTGRYPVEELTFLQPDVCLADLSDTALVMDTIVNL
jgi:phosphoglycolate phosphatase-like HAD superfamily hydrolase